MRTILTIFILTILLSCDNRQIVPRHSDVFRYVNKKTNDTIKFYVYRDIDTAILYAKKERKDILLIFSCWACMSTSGNEWKTLSLFDDMNKIQNDFILTWLPVDDKTVAKDTNQIVFWYGQQRKLKDIGDQNKYFEEQVFGQSTQPLFCFIDTTKKPFGKILGYSSDKKDVETFINSGVAK